jgi:two-component system chemotaxis sensor kinase CheA
MADFEVARYIPIFKQELIEHLQEINRLLLELERIAPGGDFKKITAELLRRTHTIKGSSRMLGFTQLADVAHQLESLLQELPAGQGEAAQRFINETFKKLQELNTMVNCLGKESPPSTAQEGKSSVEDYVRLSPAQVQRLNLLTEGLRAEQVSFSTRPQVARELFLLSSQLARRLYLLRQQAPLPGESQARGDSKVLVDSRWLYQTQQELERFKSGLRVLWEASLEAMFRLEGLVRALQAEMVNLRLLPMRELCWGLPLLLRQMAQERHKQVEFILEGGHLGLERAIAQRVKDCLVHILRNAIDHGIEHPSQRLKKGKSAAGQIKVSAGLAQDRICIQVADDGRGIDPQLIKKVALEKNLVDASQIERMSQAEIVSLVFLPGFSSTQRLSAFSGRGLGLDAVRENVERMRGQIEIDSQVDRGTRVLLRLPLVIGTFNCLLVGLGQLRLAIPVEFVRENLYASGQEVSFKLSFPTLLHNRQSLPLLDLKRVFLNEPFLSQDMPRQGFPAVVIRSLGRNLAVAVERVFGESQIILRPIPECLGQIRYLLGLGLLAQGEVVAVSDVPELVSAYFKDCLSRPKGV